MQYFCKTRDQWITIFPGILLVLLILVINLLGDWVRDYLNPKLYKRS
jgi:peptide/nickel transport system permease protein